MPSAAFVVAVIAGDVARRPFDRGHDALQALRLDRSAQWEIRRVCAAMLRALQKEAPSVFGDYIMDEETMTARSELA